MKTSRYYTVHKQKLGNSLPLLSINGFDSEAVTIMLLVRAGSINDEKPYLGAAHFLEHIFFKGTKNYPTSMKLAMATELLGGVSNAFTSYEYTGFYLKVPTKNFSKAIELFADVIFNPNFVVEDIEKERGVIAEEIKMYEDLPQNIISDEFNLRLFQDSPLGQNIAGTLSSIKKIDLETLIKFRLKNYRAENMLLVISGDIDKNLMVEQAQKYFGKVHLNTNKVKGKVVESPTKVKSKYFHIIKKTEQAHLVIGGVGLKRNSLSEYPFQLGMTILANGFGSKLFQELRERYGIAYYVRGGMASYSETGKYVIKAGVSTNKVELGVRTIINAIKDVTEGKFTNKELLRAKNYYLTSIIESLETGEDKAGWFGLGTLLERKLLAPKDQIERVEAITKEQLVKSWQSVVRKDNLMIGVLSENNINLNTKDVFSL